MRYAIRIMHEVDASREEIGETAGILDAAALAERHPGAYIYDRETGRVL